MVTVQALSTHQMFIIRRNALTMKLVLPMTLKIKNALINSRATENFLDPRTISQLQLPTTALEKPRAVHNIDGTHNQAGSILWKCQLKVQVGDKEQMIDFFITNLGQDWAVLGHPFLKTFNPNIDWKEGKIHKALSIKITPKLLATHYWKVWKADGHGQWKMDWPNNTHLRKVTFAQQWVLRGSTEGLHIMWPAGRPGYAYCLSYHICRIYFVHRGIGINTIPLHSLP